ncbi:MAG: protein-glutamate methyltransferase [Gluconacetobacter diazotrophicus]|nr:protein-glutamate methyltransferase [Gluconacetobacter diazotrophicus]
MAPEADETFRRIKSLVIRRTLHQYYEDKDSLLLERVGARLAVTGLDAEEYLALLGDPGRGNDEWDALCAVIAIGETFFFRFAEQFDALERRILPALIRARENSRRLRIWSAGCSTGAEPYSIAILLRRLLGSSLADWSISISGTDLSLRAIEAARAAEYGDWAVRTLTNEERHRDFVPVRAGTSRRWRLLPVYRGMVEFEQHNLAELLERPLGAREGSFDLVLCRNVLIYFGADQAATLAARLGECLAEDGWLLLGHAEAAMLPDAAMRREAVGDTVAWRPRPAARAGRGNGSGAAGPAEPEETPFANAADRRGRRSGSTLGSRPGSRPEPIPEVGGPVRHPPDPASEADAVGAVRALADAGRIAEAGTRCRAALAAFPLNPELFYISALLERATGRLAAAEAEFRRAIYLDGRFVMAHYHLGLLLGELDRGLEGRRSIAEAAAVAHGLPADAELPGGDGLTAGRLLALFRSGLDGGAG